MFFLKLKKKLTKKSKKTLSKDVDINEPLLETINNSEVISKSDKKKKKIKIPPEYEELSCFLLTSHSVVDKY